MIDRNHGLSVSRQAKVLGYQPGQRHYQPRPISDADLKLMHRIDTLHMEFPFAGRRMLQGLLIQGRFKVSWLGSSEQRLGFRQVDLRVGYAAAGIGDGWSRWAR